MTNVRITEHILLIAILLVIAVAVLNGVGSGIQKQMEKTAKVLSGEIAR